MFEPQAMTNGRGIFPLQKGVRGIPIKEIYNIIIEQKLPTAKKVPRLNKAKFSSSQAMTNVSGVFPL